MMSQPHDRIKVGKVTFDLGPLHLMLTVRAHAVVYGIRHVIGCERCKSICVLGLHNCACCESAVKSHTYPDDGKRHIAMMSGAEFVDRADAFLERMAA